MPKVLLPIGDAVETLDTFYPYFRLPEDGFEVVVAGPEARLYHTVLHEIPPGAEPKWDITQERPGYHLQATVAFAEVRPEEFAGLFLTGGRGPEYLRYDKHLLDITRQIVDAGKPVACVCHGIEILAAAGCLRGRRATTVAKCALDIEQVGGEYVGEGLADGTVGGVVVDGNLVTARTWHDNTALLREFVRMLKSAAKRT